MAAVIGRLAALEVKQGHIKRMVGKLADTIQSNFERLNWSFNQVVGQLTAMEDPLVSQQTTMAQTLELTSDLRYKEGFEKIEGAYAALLKGAHNLQAMLGELKGFIFELNTENVRHLSSTRLQEYLELVQTEAPRLACGPGAGQLRGDREGQVPDHCQTPRQLCGGLQAGAARVGVVQQ